MRILLFSPAFAPNMGSESIVSSKLVLALTRAGHIVDVISRPEGKLYSDNWEPPWDELRPYLQELTVSNNPKSGLMLERIRDLITMRHPLAGLRWARLALKVARKMVKSKSYDLILSRSPPDIGHLPALILTRETGLPWIANWNDPPLGIWPKPYKNGGLIEQFFHRRFASQVLKEATVNTFPSDRLAQHVCRNYGATSSKPRVIIPHVSLSQEGGDYDHKNDGIFRIFHAGKLCEFRDPDNFLKGVKLFVENKSIAESNMSIEFFGCTNSEFLALTKKNGVDKYIKNYGAIGYLEVMRRLSESSINLLIEAPCHEGIFLPSKLVDYSNAGRPILAISPTNGVVSDLIAKCGGGIVASPDSPNEIAKALEELYSAWLLHQLDKLYSPARLEKLFSQETILPIFSGIFNKILIVK